MRYFATNLKLEKDSNLFFNLPNVPIKSSMGEEDKIQYDSIVNEESGESQSDNLDDSIKNETMEEFILDDQVKKRSFPSFPEPILSSDFGKSNLPIPQGLSPAKSQHSVKSVASSRKSLRKNANHYTVDFPVADSKDTKANYISTTKYSIWTFIPKNLYFQVWIFS